MDDLPPLTLLLGPQTMVSLALNTLVREHRFAFGGKGMTVMPSRIASSLIRRCLDARPLKERQADLAAELPRKPAFLSAINFFGPPEAGLAKRELFPDAEAGLAGLAELAPGARIILAVDPLPEFFLAAGSDGLENRVRRTPWEDLYELGWADLVREVVEMLPESPVLVLTGRGAGAATGDVLARLFGNGVAALPETQPFMRQMIDRTGHAVLARMLERGPPDKAMLAEVFTSFVRTPTREDIAERLGIDKVTRALLDQRFAEDIEFIRAIPGVEVV